MKTTRLLGVLAVAGLGTIVVAGPAQAAAVEDCRTSAQHLTNRPDNGLNGVWATSDYIRTVVICEDVTVVDASATQPPNYHATVTDVGTFVTLAGPELAPGVRPGVPLAGGVPGTTKGGFTADFWAPPGFATYDPPADGTGYDGDPTTDATDGNPTTTAWIGHLFTGGIQGPGLADGSWEWIYETCAGEKWVDNETTENAMNGGNITGLPCPTPSPSPPPAGGNGLPTTGADVSGVVLAGGAALLVGAVLLAVGARRRMGSRI